MDCRLDRIVFDFLNSLELKQGCHFIIGFSGGADSTALLYLMYQFIQESSCQLSAACLNHNLRDPFIMKEEEQVIRSHCQKLGIPLFYHSLELGECDEFCEKEGFSPEEGARILRYRFFQSLIEDEERDFILLAHTRDDQIETILLRFLQGAGADGLKGIRSSQSNRIRPLLNISKEELVLYLKSRGIPYCHDQTNDENRYYRNRVRNELLPVIRSFLPGIETSLLKQGQYFREIAEIIAKQGEKILSWKNSGPFLFCDTASFMVQNFEILKADLQKKINSYRKGILKGTIPSRFYEPLKRKEFIKERKTCLVLDSYGIFLLKNESIMVLGKKSVREECLFYELKRDHFLSLWGYHWGVSKEIDRIKQKELCIQLEGLPEDYFIRPFRPQDKLLINGKQKKVDDRIPSGGKVVRPHVLVNRKGNIKALVFHNGRTPVLKMADSPQFPEKKQTGTFFFFIL